jgi:hypothetical protein
VAGKGHGRSEVRELVSTTMLSGYLDWPGACQVFELRRRRTERGVTTEELAWGISSLGRDEADAARLLSLARGHWGIENGLHWVRDVSMGEDGCRVRKGNAPQALAALRNMTVHLWDLVAKRLGGESLAGAGRHLACNPREALRLLGFTPIE